MVFLLQAFVFKKHSADVLLSPHIQIHSADFLASETAPDLVCVQAFVGRQRRGFGRCEKFAWNKPWPEHNMSKNEVKAM